MTGQANRRASLDGVIGTLQRQIMFCEALVGVWRISVGPEGHGVVDYAGQITIAGWDTTGPLNVSSLTLGSGANTGDIMLALFTDWGSMESPRFILEVHVGSAPEGVVIYLGHLLGGGPNPFELAGTIDGDITAAGGYTWHALKINPFARPVGFSSASA